MNLAANTQHCDFCAGAPVVKTLDVHDFDMGDGVRSVSGWGVCAVCANLVEIEDKAQLLERAMQSMNGKPELQVLRQRVRDRGGDPDKEQFDWLKQLHKEFWRSYKLKQTAIEAKLAGQKAAPWDTAHNMKFAALRNMENWMKIHGIQIGDTVKFKAGTPFTELEKMIKGEHILQVKQRIYQESIGVLRASDCYSFSGDALEAIKQATGSMPHDGPLSLDQIPRNGIGWWWFEPWLPVKAEPRGGQLAGILWRLTAPTDKPSHAGVNRDKELGNSYVNFTVFAMEDGMPKPTIQWSWNFGESAHALMARALLEHKKQIVPLLTERELVNLIGYASVFFLAACVWLEQEIIEVVEHRVPRQQRRQLEREHKFEKNSLGGVKVIALRRKRRLVEGPVEPSDHKQREYNWQWEVEGHFRNQPHGPGRQLRKVIYITPYVKGPDDKPLKPKAEKVFAVIR